MEKKIFQGDRIKPSPKGVVCPYCDGAVYWTGLRPHGTTNSWLVEGRCSCEYH